VDHLRQLRELQDETHGFTGFIPLAYQPEDNEIPVTTPPT
jgi:aminodeoxyfutalosine synthase